MGHPVGNVIVDKGGQKIRIFFGRHISLAHRIEYFKYRGVKVWDKKERLDEVFGSTSVNSIGILDFIKDIDAKIDEGMVARWL